MRVIVASGNPVKRRAVETAFRETFPDSALSVVAENVSSDVSAQPEGDRETRRGAELRAINARAAVPDAEYYVGLEGGVETIDGELFAFAWIAVVDRRGRLGRSRTVALPLPRQVQSLVADGVELGDANDAVFATSDSKRRGGAFGLLTNNRYTRESVYAEAVSIALVPLTNALYEG